MEGYAAQANNCYRVHFDRCHVSCSFSVVTSYKTIVITFSEWILGLRSLENIKWRHCSPISPSDNAHTDCLRIETGVWEIPVLFNGDDLFTVWYRVVIIKKISDLSSDSGLSFVLKFNLRLRNGDYQNPEIVFVLGSEHKSQKSWDWSVHCSGFKLVWVWDLLVITNSTQISWEYEIAGLSLSLRFVSNHHPMLHPKYLLKEYFLHQYWSKL